MTVGYNTGRCRDMKISRGFTLVELMVTLAVVAILLTVGVPSMTEFVKNNRLTATTNGFVSSLTLARSEAVKQGRNATLCVSSDQATCTGANWAQGWLVWVDLDSDGTLDAGETLRVAEALPQAVTFAGTQNSFQFTATGSVNNTDILTVCDDRAGETGRQLRILSTGGVSLNRQFGCA